VSLCAGQKAPWKAKKGKRTFWAKKKGKSTFSTKKKGMSTFSAKKKGKGTSRSAYFDLFRPVLAFLSAELLIPSLLQRISAFSSSFQPISAYQNLFRLISAFSSLFHSAYFGLFRPIALVEKHQKHQNFSGQDQEKRNKYFFNQEKRKKYFPFRLFRPIQACFGFS
jgi:hypothetical protein